MSDCSFDNRLIQRPVVSCFATLVAAAMLVGCGGAAGPTTKVSGKVTFEGKPIVNGSINFLATGKRPLGGFLKPDATYEAELPPGEYQVLIDSPIQLPEGFKEGDPMPNIPRPLPEKYANYNTSGLTASVKSQAEPQTIDFALP